MKEFFENAINLIFPINEICMFCRKRSKVNRHYLCDSCYQDLTCDFFSCKYCGISLIDRSFEICDDCAKGRVPFQKFIRGFALSDMAKKAVYDYKNGRRRELSYCFSSLLAELIKNNIDTSVIDCIVPVPSSKYKQRKRGFDHINDICKKLAKLLEIDSILFLEREKEGKEQKSLNKKDRLKNMEGVFSLIKYTEEPITILLVDDVLTTGATMRACREALNPLNARVYAICVFEAQK